MINKYNDNYRRRYAVLFLVSLLIHLLIFIWLYIQPPLSPANKKASTVTVQLSQATKHKSKQQASKPKEEKEAKKKEEEKAKPEPEKPQDEPKPEEKPEKKQEQAEKPLESHAPKHTADEFASRNQTDRTKDTLVDGGAVKPKTDQKKLSDNQKTVSKAEEPVNVAKKKTVGKKQELAKKDEQKLESKEKEAEKVVSAKGAKSEVKESKEKTASQTILENLLTGSAQEKTEKAALDEIEKLLGDFDSEGEAKALEFDIEEALEDSVGNVSLLSDSQLSKVEIEDPFSDKEAKEIQLVNRYLERMQKQVMAIWVNPYKGKSMHRGVIRMELSSNGILVDAFVYQSSGLDYLDQSVLDALKAVPRYFVPENEIIAERYYRNLRFFYSSIEEETELMPFEIEDED